MSVIIFFQFLTFFLIRDIAAYHPELYFTKHITIKSRRISKWLISDKPNGKYSKKIPVKDRNKITYVGFIFYIIWLALIIFSIVMINFIPDIPTEPVVYKIRYGEIVLDTFNMKLVSSFTMDFMVLSFVFNFINRFRINIKSKSTKIIFIILILSLLTGIIINLLMTFGAI